MKNISNKMMNNPKLFIIDEASDNVSELHMISDSFQAPLEDFFDKPVTVCNSYKFECKFKDSLVTSEINKLIDDLPSYKVAGNLADKLNDLVEEYHAPGTPRSERRAIKREFDKVFRIFRKHCYTYNIDFGFTRTEN